MVSCVQRSYARGPAPTRLLAFLRPVGRSSLPRAWQSRTQRSSLRARQVSSCSPQAKRCSRCGRCRVQQPASSVQTLARWPRAQKCCRILSLAPAPVHPGSTSPLLTLAASLTHGWYVSPEPPALRSLRPVDGARRGGPCREARLTAVGEGLGARAPAPSLLTHYSLTRYGCVRCCGGCGAVTEGSC